ncbi:DUF3422 family protein [Sphingopyxis sp. USTB-05]|uniref:DUF3422 family protein n=1 Tax=Sphingopyxis sp. USTB-05 TaxID=2830667 RepID=UPI002078C14F|nr:DUF3422 family protein [Sphingopyxis sp. USTB-05]
MAPIIHPQRQRVLEELHARPFTPLTAGTRLLHFGFQVSHGGADDDRARLDSRARTASEAPVDQECRYRLLKDGALRWERHGEFVTYTLRVDTDAPAAWPSGLIAPGPLLVAVDLSLLTERT